MKTKDEVLKVFIKWKDMVENHTSIKIKLLRTDYGEEYKSNPFFDVFNEYGIVWHFTIRDAPQHNGVSVCIKQTFIEKVCCILSNAGLGKKF